MTDYQVCQAGTEVVYEQSPTDVELCQDIVEVVHETASVDGANLIIAQVVVEVWHWYPLDVAPAVSQEIAEIWYRAPTPCIAVSQSSLAKSVVAQYYAIIKDQDGTRLGLLDNWVSLSISNTINDVGTATLVLDGNDPHVSQFKVDGQFEVWRSVPGSGIDWTMEFEGLFRSFEMQVDENGQYTYTVQILDYNDLLARRIVGYKGGTIMADKNDPAETVMKEYVYENCGAGADLISYVGRGIYGVIPGFTVEPSAGDGETWAGSKPFENLLDVLKDIAKWAKIDFAVVGNGDGKWIFKTFIDQLGDDRTLDGFSPASGKNGAGNAPVVFAIENANIARIVYGDDRISEANTVYVLGKSELSTQVVRVRQNVPAATASPINSREISRPSQSSEFQYQLDQYGDEILKEVAAKHAVTFEPLQQPDCQYGLHYFLGDKVEVHIAGEIWQKRILGRNILIEDAKEIVELTFEDEL